MALEAVVVFVLSTKTFVKTEVLALLFNLLSLPKIYTVLMMVKNNCKTISILIIQLYDFLSAFTVKFKIIMI